MYKLTDAHCHIHHGIDGINSQEKTLQILNRAKLSGVQYMLNIMELDNNEEQTLHYFNDEKDVFFGMGVHPLGVRKISIENAENILLKYINQLHVIGETGLDLFKDTNLEEQLKYLQFHANFAETYQKPLVIHARSCDINDILSLIKTRFQFHCYSFGVKEAKQILDLGGYISISGIITFTKTSDLDDVVKYCPKTSLLIETDCPFLAPKPYRGKENEPAFIIETYKHISNLLDIKIEDLQTIIANNFKRFIFG